MPGEAERAALTFLLRDLRRRGEAEIRRAKLDAPAVLHRAQHAVTALSEPELINLLRSQYKSFDGRKAIYLASPYSKEESAVAVLWCRWDFRGDAPDCGYYFGVWTLVANQLGPVPTPNPEPSQVVVFTGYRFETPNAEGESHKFFHAQPCQTLLRQNKIVEALPISSRQPTFPVPADNVVELMVCLHLSLYGLDGLRELKRRAKADPDARRDKLLIGSLEKVEERCAYT